MSEQIQQTQPVGEYRIPTEDQVDAALDQYVQDADAKDQARHLEMKTLLTAELAKDEKAETKPAA